MLLEEGIPSLLRRTAGFDVPDFLAAGPRDVFVPQSGALAAREALGVPAPGPGALPRSSTARPWVRALAAALAVFVVACVAAAVHLRHRAVIWVRYVPPGRARAGGLRVRCSSSTTPRSGTRSPCSSAPGSSLPLLNVLFRFGAKGDEEREGRGGPPATTSPSHGRWPDDD